MISYGPPSRSSTATAFSRTSADNPSAAVDERIAAAVRRLREFPESDRPGRVAGTRELVITGTPYIAGYAVAKTTVHILRVLHAAQQWPDKLPES